MVYIVIIIIVIIIMIIIITIRIRIVIIIIIMIIHNKETTKKNGDKASRQAKLQEVVAIQSTASAFAAVTQSGRCVAWGDAQRGGDCQASDCEGDFWRSIFPWRSIFLEIYIW